jgi:hypothetical protein
MKTLNKVAFKALNKAPDWIETLRN